MTARSRANAEWARMQQVTQARNRVERLNDGSLEWLILANRAAAVVGFLGVWVFVSAGILTGDWRVFAVAGVQALAAVATGWFGWWHYGNAEWRKHGPGQ